MGRAWRGSARCRRANFVILLLLLLVPCCAVARAEVQEIKMPAAAPSEPISFGAATAQRWREGNEEIWLLEGGASVRQEATVAQGEKAVLWVELGRYGERTGKVTAYLEGSVVIQRAEAGKPDNKFTTPVWLGTFDSAAALDIRIGAVRGEPTVKPAVYRAALDYRNPARNQEIRRTHFFQEVPPPANVEQLPPGTRSITAYPRSSFAPTIDYFPNEQAGEWVALITGGINVIINGLPNVGAVDISADRVVVWTGGLQEPNLSPNATNVQQQETPLEIYMEGNIVFREGQRKIEAQRMYYDVRAQVGIVLEADVLTPVQQFQGLVRLRSRIMRQLGPGHFVANDAFVTSSLMGRPTYRLQAGEIVYQDEQRPAVDPLSGQPVIDPNTEEPVIEHDKLATSNNNFLYLGEFPVFYWPTMATDLDQPTYYIKNFRIRNDGIFGKQVLTTFDMYQILGIRERPVGTNWDLSLDYFSQRGFGFGTNFRYDRRELFGINGPATGFLDAWAIDDRGNDTLGADRRNVPPGTDFRYRLLGQHRQHLADGWQFTGELGKVSDRNFLEQYYEAEWDQFKDQSTGVDLKRLVDNMSYGISADVRLNEFFTQTEWLPRLDHFWLGQPLLGDRFTWFEHTSVAYGRMRTAATPDNAIDANKFGFLPWEATASGERLITRQEIDYPLDVGPVKFVPYALGELGHWGEALDGSSLDRAYGQVGLRASIPFWTANPLVESHLLNVHGIAHKVVFDADLSFADATRDMTELPLYDALDDDNIEQFRRRLAFNTFGVALPSTGIDPVTGVITGVPPQFDARSYALRNGLGSWVTSPSMEVADDMALLRLGARQRWQTKRGPAQNRRIIDWIVLDTQATIFPNADRDNFGETLGLLQYYFRWHVGDRLALVSDGMFDFFDQGQKQAGIGAFLSRPPRGSLFVGLQSLEGPFESQVLSASYTYRLSPKWFSTAGASVDLAKLGGNIGQNFTVARIGETFVTSFNFTYDHSKNNVGVMFNVEPRFLRFSPAGLMGLE